MKTCREKPHPAHLRLVLHLWKKSLSRLTKILMLLISIPTIAATDLPFCSEFFRDGVQTHGEDSFIRFGYNAQLQNASSRFLWTPKVQLNVWSRKRNCGDLLCVSTGTPIDSLVIPHLDTYAKDELLIPAKSVITLGANNQTRFGKMEILENALVIFSRQPTAYFIDSLHLGHKSQLRLAAGEYWIGELNLEVEGKIDVIGEGTVSLYVLNALSIPFKFTVNGNTKNPAKLGIYAFSDSNYNTGSKTYAFIRTEGEVILSHKASIFGGVLGKYITLESESKVVFDPEALQDFSLVNMCSGAAPLRDETPPVIEIDYGSFANPTAEGQIIVRGKVNDPGQDSRWIDSVFVRNWETRFAITLTGNEFTAVLPLSSQANIFTFGATDKAGNTAYKDIEVLREPVTPLSFGFEDSFIDPILTPELILHGFVVLPPRDAIASAFVTTQQGTRPLRFFGNKFSVDLPMTHGDNNFTFNATSNSGVSIRQDLVLEGSSVVEFQRIFTYGSGDQPERLISGRVHSLWPAEQLQLTIEDTAAKLIPEKPGVYRFEQKVNLSVGRNRLDVVVTTPEGESFSTEVDDWYEPDRIFLSIHTPNTHAVVQTETISIAGDIHLPPDFIDTSTHMVATSDRFPGIEYPLAWLAESAILMKFTGEVPLALGANNLVVKLKKGKKDVVVDVGMSHMDIQVTRRAR